MGNKPHTKGKLYHRHFKLIGEAAVKQFITGKRTMYIWFPKETIYPDDFPFRRRKQESETHIQYSINVVKMIDWLYKEGRLEYNSSMLLKNVQAVNCRILGLMNFDMFSNLKGEENGD